MKKVLGLVLLSAIPLTLAITACGGGDTGPQAGRVPPPSQESPRALPMSGSGAGGAPMFSGGGRARGGGALAGTPWMEKARRESERQLAGPQRLGESQRQIEGQRIAQELQQAAAQARASADPDDASEPPECVEQWGARQSVVEGIGGEDPTSRATFMRICRAMPEPQRRCGTPSYFESHRDECVELQTTQGERAMRQGHVVGRDGPVRHMQLDPRQGSGSGPQALAPTPTPTAPTPTPTPTPTP
jgi:hypothetical protein